MTDVIRILNAIEQGDAGATDELPRLVYEDFSGKALEILVRKGEHYGLSGKFVFKDHLGYEPEELYARFYTYEVKSGRYNYGKTLHFDKPVTAGKWYCVEQYIKLNTPGKKDGIARAWINGEPVFEKTDFLCGEKRRKRGQEYES